MLLSSFWCIVVHVASKQFLLRPFRYSSYWKLSIIIYLCLIVTCYNFLFFLKNCSVGESSVLDKSLNPGLDNIGVRVPNDNFIRAISRGSKSALALTSANLSGQPSSVCIKDFETLWEHCAYVYDGGVLPSGRAGSTVVDLTRLGKYKILRPGR